jgi:hypothetical protein
MEEPIAADRTIARIYPNASLDRSPEYYDYDRLQVQWR